MLVSAAVTAKSAFYAPHLSWVQIILSIIMIIHNLATAFYASKLAKWYLSMGVKNMHAVEECDIGNIYDKAKYHKLWDYSQPKIFYYTRPGGALNNLAEMLGTRNLFFWLLPLPHFNR